MTQTDKAVQMWVFGLIAVGAIVWAIRSSSAPVSSPASSPPSSPVMRFNEYKICDEASSRNFDHSNEENVDHFDITLTEGCFDAFFRPPKSWHNWFWQPIGDTNGWWLAFWWSGRPRPDGPFGPNAKPDLGVPPTNFYRLQGHGKVRIYTNDVVASPDTQAPDGSPKEIPVGYQKRFCDEPNPTTPEGTSLKITLAPGCFAGPWYFKQWHAYNVDKSRNEGDWAVAWCEGVEHPSKIRPYYEDFKHEDLDKCTTIYFQGQGTLHFTKLK
jgi:hypothetical protein